MINDDPAVVAQTFLFTDLEGSTRTWEREPEAMDRWLARHDEIVTASVVANHGRVFKHTGDGICAVFATADDAMRGACEVQRALAIAGPEEVGSLRVRMAIHSGIARERGGDFYGPTLNRCARLLEAGHGCQVLVSGAVASLVAGVDSELSLLDLGQYRLRDLQQPERVFQLAGPGLERDFPPLRSLDAFVHNLPVQRSSFIGREAERAVLHELLEANRLVTVTGVGGCGKTRLTLEVAATELDRFPDGVFFADLSAIAEPGAVASATAAALRVPLGPGTTEERLADFIADRRMLIVIDNCEHLLDVCAAVIEALLQRCARLVVLTTSREPLSLDGERVWRVPSLGVPSEDDAEIGESESVRLFVDRAAAVRPGFSLTAENGVAVAEICRRLDGIPLALELAAARAAHMAPGEIAARLTDRFRLLSTGRRGIQRQQTLQAVLDWSYDLLSDAEQRLLRRLAVFAGGWSLDAAQAVCSDEGLDSFEIIDLLGNLVGRSLVELQDHDGCTRYRLLETVRLYAQDRVLAANEAVALRQRHAEWYLHKAETRDGRDVAVARTWFAYNSSDLIFDGENVRQAADWFAAGGQHEQLARISPALVGVLGVLARSDEIAELVGFGLAHATKLPAAVCARLQAAAGRAAEIRGEFMAANEHARAAIASAESPADAGGAYSILLANVVWGDPDEADRLLEFASQWTTPLGPEAENYILTARATVANARQDYTSALSMLSRVTNDQSYAALSAEKLVANLLCGNVATAEKQLHEGLGGAGVTWFAYLPSYLGALVAVMQGNTVAARAKLSEAVALVQRWRTPLGLADCVVGCAAVALCEGDARRACQLLATVRGATGGGLRTTMSMTLYRHYVGEVRRKLDAESIKQARAKGAELTLEAAIESELGVRNDRSRGDRGGI